MVGQAFRPMTSALAVVDRASARWQARVIKVQVVVSSQQSAVNSEQSSVSSCKRAVVSRRKVAFFDGLTSDLARASSAADGTRVRVTAATFLLENCLTDVMNVVHLAQIHESGIPHVQIAQLNGRLFARGSPHDCTEWVKTLNFAPDCSSSNVILMANNRGVYLKTLRDIYPDEALMMWFSADLLTVMEMLILPPHTIRGSLTYECPTCKTQFKSPNPLKLHLALNCNRYNRNYLWIKLAENFRAVSGVAASTHLSPNHMILRFDPSLHASRSTASRPHSVIRVPIARHSPAFDVPLVNLDATVPQTTSTPLSQYSSTRYSDSPLELSDNLTFTPGRISLSPSSKHDPVIQHHVRLNDSSASLSPPMLPYQASRMHIPAAAGSAESLSLMERESQLQESRFRVNVQTLTETRSAFRPYDESLQRPVVRPLMDGKQPFKSTPMTKAELEIHYSNLGKRPNGFICVFCEKLYSRKYGLKIHLRTHTGYKPLKCTYCKKQFGDPSNLNKHVRLHGSGYEPYRCHICGKSNIRGRDLRKHMQSKHNQNGDTAHLH